MARKVLLAAATVAAFTMSMTPASAANPGLAATLGADNVVKAQLTTVEFPSDAQNSVRVVLGGLAPVCGTLKVKELVNGAWAPVPEMRLARYCTDTFKVTVSGMANGGQLQLTGKMTPGTAEEATATVTALPSGIRWNYSTPVVAP